MRTKQPVFHGNVCTAAALLLVLCLAGGLVSCQTTAEAADSPVPPALKLAQAAKAPSVVLTAPVLEVEVGKTIPLSARAVLSPGIIPSFSWKADKGSVAPAGIDGEVDYTAPAAAGTDTVTVTVGDGSANATASLAINVLAAGSLKRSASVTIKVDTNALKGVYVDDTHPSENFTGPLKVKGEFRADPDTLEAFAGGSWPTYDMYDDGTHGDAVKGDGIWTITFTFEKSDGKVHFAFDEGSAYRKQWESGVGFALKQAWMRVAGPDLVDPSDLYFIPMKDQVIEFGAALANDPRAKLYRK